MLLFYIRHGEPIYDPNRLTPLGERQAEALARRLARYGLDEIYVSPSHRARQTAEPTQELLHLTPTVLDWCSEDLAWGEFTVADAEGHRRWVYQDAEARKLLVSPEIAALGDDWYRHDYFRSHACGDGTARIRANTYSFLESLGYRFNPASRTYTAVAPNEKRVALFAHEGFGMAFLSSVLGIPYPLFSTHMGLGHSSMTVIRFANSTTDTEVIPEMLQLSNDSHLYAENLPTRYNGETPI